MNTNTDSIVFYDGHCSFCHFWVRYIIRADRQKRIQFAPLHGKTAAPFLSERNLNANDSIIFWHPGVAYYTESGAVFEIARTLGGFHHLLRIFSILPRPLTDAVYTLIARARYRLSKRYATCPVPPESVRERFLD